jgi:hypothetical protein
MKPTEPKNRDKTMVKKKGEKEGQLKNRKRVKGQ